MHRSPVVIAVFVVGALISSEASAAPSKRATVSFEAPKLTGSLDVTLVTAVVKRSKRKVLACYKKALAKTVDLRGTITAKFTIGADGKVTASAASGLATGVDACVAAAIRKLKFAKPKDGKPVDVTYPVYCDPGSGELPDMSGSGGYGAMKAGGGTGVGVIGVGRYDSIRTGSGTGGYGIGSGRGRLGRASGTTVGQPATQGELDKAIIRRAIRRNIAKISSCYEKQLAKDKKLNGTVTAKFTIGTHGRVSSATATGLHAEVSSCVAGVIKAIEFPKPKKGHVDVTYPFAFRPAEDEAAN